MDAAFVGRRNELSYLTKRFGEASRGEPRVVLIEGPAGIGKTALVHQFLSGTDGYRGLHASGDASERGLNYGVVEQLFASAGDLAVDTVESEGGVAPDHTLQVGAKIVDLLGKLQVDDPIVMVIDDVHWVDTPSLHALGFAFRRLGVDRVLVLMTLPGDEMEGLPTGLRRVVTGPIGDRLRLRGLSTSDLLALCEALMSTPVSPQTAARLQAHTEGNPLFVRTLLEELPKDSLRGHALPLPVPRSFGSLVARRLDSCSDAARALVAAAAILGSRCPLSAASQLAGIDDPWVALDDAMTARLLEEVPAAVERLVTFPHPLVHAAVYHGLGPAKRAVLHARAAGLVEDEPSQIRHRLAATTGPDPVLAAELVNRAHRSSSEGSWAVAAGDFLAAGRLAASRRERGMLLLKAIEQLLLGGHSTEAVAYLPEVTGLDDSAQRDYVLARLATVQGQPDDAARLFRRAWERCDRSLEPELASAVAEEIALDHLLRARGDEAATWARRAISAAPAGLTTPSNMLDTLTMALVISGRPAEALALTADLPRPGHDPSEVPDGWIGRALARMWTDDLIAARADLTTLLATYQPGRAPAQWALIGRALLAEVHYRLGAWDDAIGESEVTVSLVRDTDQDWLAPLAHAVAAFPLAARGATDAAHAHTAAARDYLAAFSTESSTVWVSTAQALVALAEEDNREIVERLAPLRQLSGHASIDEPGWPPWRPLYAEALIGLGRTDEADEVLLPFEAVADERGLHSASMTAARVRGLYLAAIGKPRVAEESFVTGLEHASGVHMPFDQARLELAYGGLLRRAGERRRAVAQLQGARTRLAALAAVPYLQRCDRELVACGHRPKRRDPVRTTLTPQELAVARLVAAGRSNREAATEMFVSIKTIEYHLGNTYAKLGIHSRTQLAFLLRQDRSTIRTGVTQGWTGSAQS